MAVKKKSKKNKYKTGNNKKKRNNKVVNNKKKNKKKNNVKINNNVKNNKVDNIKKNNDINNVENNGSLNNIEVNNDISNVVDNKIEDIDDKKINIDIKKDNNDEKINNSVNCREEKYIDDELEKTVIVDTIDIDNELVNDGKNKKWIGIITLLLCVFMIVMMILFFPRIKLYGDNNIIISYRDSYVEDGYSVKILNKDVTEEIKIVGNIHNGVVGEYKIEYYLDKFGIRFKKYRNVSIVDKDSPLIDTYSDVINVCPNGDIPEIEYSAIDEYDGDITSRVEKIINDNEIILSVTDMSNNYSSKSIKIDRVDKVNPVIKLNGDSIMFLSYGSTYNEPGYTVNDNCSSDLLDKVVVSGTVGEDIGTYILTYTVEDDSGNKGTVTRKVIVGYKIKDDGVINNGSIYLTFDDGPNEGTTNKILDILKDEGVKATFFVTCNGPDYLIKRMYDEGHTVALHTATHDYSYIYSSVDNYFSDLNKVKNRVKNITGYDSNIIRFPGGSSNTVSKSYKRGIMTELSYLVLNEGYRYFDWNVDAMDATSAKTSEDVYYNVTSNLMMNRANVVLMHDTKSITASAIRNIIQYGKENGCQFKEIDMNTYMVRHSVNN